MKTQRKMKGCLPTIWRTPDDLWAKLLTRYDHLRGIRWQWQSLDSVTVKPPLGGRQQAQIRRIGANSAPSATR